MGGGWTVAGVEPSAPLAEFAKRAAGGRADVQCCSLQDARFDPRSFDAITLFDVLEHVPDPIAFVASCRRLLKPDGLLFVNVPDIGSGIARLLGKRWPLLLPEHLNYFDRNSLQRCAGAAGFRVVQFSSRAASFSVGYVLHRLGQHDIPGARPAARWLDHGWLSSLVVSVPLGESLTAWRVADDH
jgi:SAM-dependent methyltransferase